MSQQPSQGAKEGRKDAMAFKLKPDCAGCQWGWGGGGANRQQDEEGLIPSSYPCPF